MNVYLIRWTRKCYGESFVKASSLDEAKQKAENAEDENFDWIDEVGTVEMSEIVELDNERVETKTYLELS